MINILFNKMSDVKATIEDHLPDRRSPSRKIADKALELAYPEDIAEDIYEYNAGMPSVEYWDALNNAFPKRVMWSRAYKSGAADDLFVATVIREAGIDPEFPRKRGKSWTKGQMGHLEFSEKWQRVKVNKKNIKDGDIIVYSKFPGAIRGHICIHVDGKIVEASTAKKYPVVVDKLSDRLSRFGKPIIRIYRAREL